MKSLWKIARWEIMRNLTNKQFIIGLLLTPLIMVLFAVVPYFLERWNQPSLTTYYVVDELGAVETLQAVLPETLILKLQDGQADLAKLVQETNAHGYFTLEADFAATGRTHLFYNKWHGESISALRQGLTVLLQQLRLSASEIRAEQVAFVTAPAEIMQISLQDEAEPERMQFAVSMVFTVLIFMLIFTSGTMLMQSALQEKRDRMAEVVLSSIRPAALMQGKILGHFILGLIQLGFWLAIGLPLAVYFLELPLLEILAGVNLPVILFFGLGGYFLYSALFVGLGATMEDLQSAGNSQGLVIMLPMLGFLFLAPTATNPEGAVAVFASLFPFTSPVIMMMRSGLAPVPLWQLLTSGALLLATGWLFSLGAANVFRVGMLMYGKNAAPKEIIKWLRYKEN